MKTTFRTRQLCAGLAASMILLLGGAAHAEKKILVLPFSGSVPGAPDGAARLTQVVARAASLTGATMIMGQATFEDATALMGCSSKTAECFAELAASLEVEEVVIGDLQASPDAATLTIGIVLYQDGEVHESELSFPIEDIDALVARLAREAPALFVPGGETTAAPVVVEAAPAAEPDPAPEVVLTPAAPTEEPAPQRGVGVLPWAVMASGLVVGGAGAGFWILGDRRQDEVEAAPLRSADDFERLVELEDEGERYVKLGNGLVIAGGALVATGAVLAIVRSLSGDDPSESPIALGASPVAGGFALSLSVTTR